MLSQQGDVLAAIEKIVIETLASEGNSPPAGLERVATAALSPIAKPLSQFRTALGLGSCTTLPPLIENSSIQMARGLNDTCHFIYDKMAESFGSRLCIIDGDSDVHPNYRFSAAFEGDNKKRIALKFRDAGAERFLSRILDRIQVSRSIYVPSILPGGDGICMQDFVETTNQTKPRNDIFWYDAGRYIAVCDIIGLNDMHISNVLVENAKLAVIDAETILQNRRLNLNPRYCALDSHCLFPFGYKNINSRSINRTGYIKGCIAKAIAEEISNSDDNATLLNLILEGYSSWGDIFPAVLDEIPDKVTTRAVRFPTAVYGEILSGVAAKHYYSSQEKFKEALFLRMNTLWSEQSAENLEDAEVLSKCQIPFRERTFSHREARKYVVDAAARISSTFQERMDGLHEAVSQALSTSKPEG